MTSGATEAITACLMALLDPGDEVVLIEPLYDTYLPVVRLLGAVPRLVRLDPPDWDAAAGRAGGGLRPAHQGDPAQLADEPDRQGVHRDELGFIADLLARHDAYAVCDEVYEHLTFDGHAPHPADDPAGDARADHAHRQRRQDVLASPAGRSATSPRRRALAPVVAKAHQNLTFTTAPNLQRAVAVGLAKDDAYFARPGRRSAGAARPAGGGARRARDGGAALPWQLFHHRRFSPARLHRRRRRLLPPHHRGRPG